LLATVATQRASLGAPQPVHATHRPNLRDREPAPLRLFRNRPISAPMTTRVSKLRLKWRALIEPAPAPRV
jgi:hypothetical protein